MRFFRSIYRYLSRHRTPYSHSPLYLQAETLSNSSLPIRTFESSNSWSNLNFARELTASAQESKPAPSENVSAIVDEISGLTLLEVADLTEVLRKKLGIEEMPVMTIIMPGMGFGVKGAGKGAAGTGEKGEEKKAEKTAFDLKLEGGYEPGVKIKIIKEVRTFTGLGLKEAKDLVEKAPTLLKKGVSKEEAESIIRKMKDAGAKVTME